MSDKPLILAVDHNHRNQELLVQFLERAGYRTLTAASLEEFDRTLAGAKDIALVLISLAGFGRNIWEHCERLRKAGIPFYVISPRQSAPVQRTGLAHGARGVLVKPLVVKELLALIGRLPEA